MRISTNDIVFRFALLAFTYFVCCANGLADADLRLPRVVVDSGGPYVCRDMSVQKFNDAIVIPTEYLRQPLSMVCTNGAEKEPGYSWVRVFLLPDKVDADLQNLSQPLGRLLIDESSFIATAQVYLDMSGQFRPGSNKICVEAAGRPGAVYAWEIRSIGQPILYMPSEVGVVAGSWLNINGAGFSLRPDENTVQLGPVGLPVGESSFSSLNVFVPKEFPAGTYDLKVSLRSYSSRAIKVLVQAPAK